ncbi:MAG: hypothetical protein ACTSRA_05905 [Promethearchaeota archaeon]
MDSDDGRSLTEIKQNRVLINVIRSFVLICRFSVGLAITLLFTYYSVFNLIAISSGLVSFIDIWPPFALALCISAILIVSAWFSASTRIGQLLIFLGNALAIFALWNPMDKDTLNSFPLFLILKWAMLGIIIFGGLLALVNFITMCFSPSNLVREKGAFLRKVKANFNKQKKLIISGFIIIGVAFPVGLMSILPQTYHQVIVIEPKNYQAKFAFWSTFDYNAFTDTQKAELNEHGVKLVIYHPPNVTSESGRNHFVNTLEAWKTNYPNVKFELSVQGITRVRNTSNMESDFVYNTFPWDGSAEGVVYWSKEILKVVVEENLTNVVGINTDQESPADWLATNYSVDIQPNTARHLEAIRIYNEFFDWLEDFEANASRDFIVTSTMGTAPVIDVFDDDIDMQINDMVNVYDIDGWDEIAPMIYRCGFGGTPPFGDIPRTKPEDAGKTSAWVYYKLKSLHNALIKVDGNADRLGIYLGITNCTCYGRDVEQYDPLGRFTGYGFDELVKDALIAKHFGAKYITIFILNTVVTEDGYSMGGVFDSYGDDFLDRFNESVNGVNSTTRFTIVAPPNIDLMDDFQEDLLYNLGKPIGFALMLIIIGANFALSMIIHPTIKQKIKDKIKKRRSNDSNV